MDGKEKSTEQGVPCLKTKGGLCDAGQLRLFIIIAPFFCRISLTVILMRKNEKNAILCFFFLNWLVVTSKLNIEKKQD